MNTEKMWMVRAGESAYLVDEFKEKNIIAIGWGRIGDLSKIENGEKIKEKVREKYSEDRIGKINISAGQIKRFRLDFKKGDKVVTYDPTERNYYVGEIISDYLYDKELCEYHHIRKVKWYGIVERDKLSASTKNTLGAISTLFEIGEDAAKEIWDLLEGKKEEPENQDTQDEELDLLKEDMESKSHEFIKDKVLALNWEEMEELVAGLLRGMGYKTILSGPGPDRGRDILASPDGLGLNEPRIIVEVKHRAGKIGAKDIRSFTGGLRSGNKGLYISTGGFKKDAKYEAERSTIPITLVNADRLINLIVQYYDEFDSEAKTLIPLTKIYWPA